MSLGENIKNKRNELKLSQEYIADQLGVSRQAVSKWETGQSEPTASNLIQLAELFEISLSELVHPEKCSEKQETIPEKHSKKWVYLLLLAVIVLLGTVIILLVRAGKKDSMNSDKENIITFEWADFEEGEEYYLRGLPWGSSVEELLAMLPSSYELVEGPVDESAIDGEKTYFSLSEGLLNGRKVGLVFTFLYDELVKIEFTFDDEASREERFEAMVAEFTELYGPESEMIEDEKLKQLSYIWQTDNSMLSLHHIGQIGEGNWMSFWAGCTEAERERIIAKNNKETRELLLTDFKYEQEYRFSEIPWNSSRGEVEALLDCTLEEVPLGAEDYAFYDFADVIYVLNGYKAKVFVEFSEGKFVDVNFTFKAEEPKVFFEEIVSVLQEQYGPESNSSKSELTGYVSYAWRTETTLLGVGFDEEGDEWVKIYLNFPEAFAND